MPEIARWKLIGAPSWPLNGKDLATTLGVKHRALLAQLLIESEPIERDRLATMLWPDSEPSRALHSLRQALVGLRNTLGQEESKRLLAEGRLVAFEQNNIETDLAEFEKLEHFGGTAENVQEVLRGQLLEGLDGKSAEFQKQLESWRSLFAERALRVIDDTIVATSDTGGETLNALEEMRARFAREAPAQQSWADAAVQMTSSALPRRHGALWKVGAAAVIGVVVGVAIMLGAFAFSGDFRTTVRDFVSWQENVVPRIAVRPFSARGGLERERNLAGGVTIGVTYALYSITDRDLFVVTAPNVESSETSNVQEFADELGVRYLIHGNVEIDQSTVRVFVRFFDAEAGTDIWQDRFDSKLTEAFSLQDEITLRILRGMDIDLSTAERNRLQYLDDTDNLNAWLLAANGVRHLIKLDPRNLDAALASYRKALAVDPDYISARRGLAWHALLDVRFGTSEDPDASIREARQHLDVILRKQPNDGMSRALEGLLLILEDDWDGAISSGEEAARLLPGSADVWAVLAHNYSFFGEPDMALSAIERAMELSPGHPDFYHWIKGRAYRLKGEWEPAIDSLKIGLGSQSPSIVQLVELAAAYSAAGRDQEALQTGLQIKQIAPGFKASEWVLHPAFKDPDAQSLEFELLSKAGL